MQHSRNNVPKIELLARSVDWTVGDRNYRKMDYMFVIKTNSKKW